MPLNDRSYGYEFAGYERNLLFDPDNKFDNTGYVRFISRKQGTFVLDPSPYYPTQKEEVYFLKEKCIPPQENQLIHAVVLETKDQVKKDRSDDFYKVFYKYVSDWSPVDPNKIRGQNLFIKDEFLNFLGESLEKSYGIEDLVTCMGMYMCSSPQLSEFEKGGINTTIIESFNSDAKWKKFNQIMKVIPPEFRKRSSRLCYLSLTDHTPVNPVNCCELSIAYPNFLDVPIQIPMPFIVDFKKQDKESWNTTVDVARTFMLDALLFQPQIPEGMEKQVEETMYQLNETIKYTYNIPCYLDIGSLLPKLTTSLCRLNFMPEADKDNLKKSLGAWSNLLVGTHSLGTLLSKYDKLYDLKPEERTMLNELEQMEDTGVELTIDNLKKITKVFEWKFEEILNGLKVKGHIYFPRNNKIGLIRDR